VRTVLGDERALQAEVGAVNPVATMRALLAQSGIYLDDAPDRDPIAAPVTTDEPAPDRGAIRAILVAAGAPQNDLDWLTASCPSIEAAQGYRPPPRIAWCIACCGPARQDDNGCIDCRESGEKGPTT
jgi:hypothetical protein